MLLDKKYLNGIFCEEDYLAFVDIIESCLNDDGVKEYTIDGQLLSMKSIEGKEMIVNLFNVAKRCISFGEINWQEMICPILHALIGNRLEVFQVR